MNRINVTEDAYKDGQGGFVGWFDLDKAKKLAELRNWDGSNFISLNTGSQWTGQEMYRTAEGRWVLHFWSSVQGDQDTFHFVTDAEAKTWLLYNEKDDAVVEFFGQIEEEQGPGRPGVGPLIDVCIPGPVIARLDAEAASRGESRAAAIRRILDERYPMVVADG